MIECKCTKKLIENIVFDKVGITLTLCVFNILFEILININNCNVYIIFY